MNKALLLLRKWGLKAGNKLYGANEVEYVGVTERIKNREGKGLSCSNTEAIGRFLNKPVSNDYLCPLRYFVPCP